MSISFYTSPQVRLTLICNLLSIRLPKLCPCTLNEALEKPIHRFNQAIQSFFSSLMPNLLTNILFPFFIPAYAQYD